MTPQYEDGTRDWRDDTITGFPAVSGGAEIIPAAADPCTCGMCPSSAEPGKDALLSCAPGVTSRMWRTRVANGQWESIPAAWDKAHAATHLPTLDRQRRIHAQLAARRHDIAAMLSRSPSLLADRVLRDGLADMESRFARGLEEARIRSEDQARAWTGTERAA